MCYCVDVIEYNIECSYGIVCVCCCVISVEILMNSRVM